MGFGGIKGLSTKVTRVPGMDGRSLLGHSRSSSDQVVARPGPHSDSLWRAQGFGETCSRKDKHFSGCAAPYSASSLWQHAAKKRRHFFWTLDVSRLVACIQLMTMS